MFLKAISYRTTLFMCTILGVKQIYIDRINTSYGYRCLKYKGINVWNSLPNSFKYITSTICYRLLFH